MEHHITHLSCETQPEEICVLTGGFQRWLELDRESNQRERRGATRMKAPDPTINQTERWLMTMMNISYKVIYHDTLLNKLTGHFNDD